MIMSNFTVLNLLNSFNFFPRGKTEYMSVKKWLPDEKDNIVLQENVFDDNNQ